MRYYRIEVSGGVGAAANPIVWTSHPNGTFDPGALDVEFDIQTASFAAPVGNNHVKIWGIEQLLRQQASDFNGAHIKVYGGMAQGLPLATAAYQDGQQGLLAEGRIFQAWGNWVDLDQSIEFIFTAGDTPTDATPANLAYTWAMGTKLGDDIKQTLSTAFPAATVVVNVSDSLILLEDDPGSYTTIQAFTSHVNDLSKTLVTDPTYNGVDIVSNGQTYTVYDNVAQAPGVTPRQIRFQDMIGQPVWIQPAQVQVNLMMRADLTVSQSLLFPKAATTSTEAEQTLQAQDKSSFSGQFTVVFQRHVGHYRNPSGDSWLTTINAVAPLTPATAPYQPDPQSS